ncbi:FMN adenylyltransferase [Candidatus Peregrinibacteria bacterium CG22_combo_CG10-13_8_21_14_all_44_10]|nr:MAG: hypothetical protein AUK45_03610 [Candidatus Peregrinibacteria bacterium CG2_30_44_17]PIP66672.1 MAG: FMN adenylyltransferase [Candidatus Peregrinibacteria bacterium CG22_combo_CG10-13_8_21_14_all_44_10]PIS03735.1 MAG: FMN adenylyltransferase [Candidatus Peregrinibacteria bacterium CG10_big_fil_rev_8_21_14_0_10_44_7]PIX80314.1 MAG: FMN adenylyltransferase [Candidatus Peregrinibacteria bacterium CG_4_10_14_3_um_filter_44_21]PJB89193.1 MAG: FMN adenylyltransferase [Candidatus Peregrinibac
MKKFKGKVIKGHGLGRKLGFPTINLESMEQDTDGRETGVFVVRVTIDGQMHWGVMHAGQTIKGNSSCEVHILDFSGDVYGKEVSVEVLEKIRETWKFDNLENLREQIELDVELAKEKVLDLK